MRFSPIFLKLLLLIYIHFLNNRRLLTLFYFWVLFFLTICLHWFLNYFAFFNTLLIRRLKFWLWFFWKLSFNWRNKFFHVSSLFFRFFITFFSYYVYFFCVFLLEFDLFLFLFDFLRVYLQILLISSTSYLFF